MKKRSKKGPKPQMSLRVEELQLSNVRGRPIKIAADFDTALAALIAVPSPKKRRKSGRP